MEFKFIGLFAGIGGVHIAMKSVGGRRVFASETDKYAGLTHESNHKDEEPSYAITRRGRQIAGIQYNFGRLDAG